MARSTPINSGYKIINGICTGINAKRVDVWVEYKIGSKNAAGNYTPFTAYFYAALKPGYETATSYDSGLYSTFTVDGTAGTAVTDGPYDFRTVDAINLLGSFSKNITHNSDGKKTVEISGSFTTKSEYISGGNISATVELPTIERESSVSATNANIGAKTVISINRADSNFRHTLSYAFGNLTGTIATKTSETSISWTVPTDFYEQIPDAQSGKCTITCKTYSGDALIGSTSCTFTATASQSDCAPTFPWFYVNDDNITTRAVTGDINTLVRYQSTAKASALAQARNGAKMVSLTVTNGSNTETTKGDTGSTTMSYSTVSMYVSGVSTPRFVFTAVDSRGYSSTEIIDAPMVNYVNLSCVLTKVQTTVGGDISFAVSGSYYPGTFGAVSNSLNVYYRYKQKGGKYCDNIAIADISISDNTYTATFSISGLDYRATYTFEAGATDAIVAINSSEKTVKFEPVFDWGENDFKFNVPVTMPQNQYYKTDGTPALDLNNSDIANANGMYFRDACDTNGEGLNFVKDRDSGVYDRLYVYKGNVLVALDEVCGTGEGVGTVYTVFNSAIKPYYEAGDSVTIDTVYAGFVTSSSKKFYFMIPLSKPVLSKKVTLSGKVSGRGINGYVLDSHNNPVDLEKTVDPFTTALIVEGGVRVIMEYEAAQETGVTNNTPINWVGAITLTFSN